jgi:radical SAM superfamily enzyme YgiQ (UPF0313 family)
MDYVGQIFRPPSEAPSLLLQITIGCSHNRCTYCAMYRDKQFKPKSWETIEADLKQAQAQGAVYRRVFLCDGDALILSTKRLLQVLEGIRTRLPWVERVGTYADTRSVGRKTVAELTELREAGLGIVYHGMESGDDEVLEQIEKGGNREECIATAAKLKEAGILHSVMVMLGVGGHQRSEEHARNTATALTKMDPDFVGALTTTIVPGTPLHQQQAEGAFKLPGKFEMLRELRTILAESSFSNCRFSSNHASNYLPLRTLLPRDQQQVVALLDEVLASNDERLLKPEAYRGL